jgi:hypothetical protein
MDFPIPVREEESHTPAMLRMPYQNKTPYMTTTYNRQSDSPVQAFTRWRADGPRCPH